MQEADSNAASYSGLNSRTTGFPPLLGKDIPAGPMVNSGYRVFGSNMALTITFGGEPPLSMGVVPNGEWVADGILTPQQAYILDKKLDDGIPQTGKIQAALMPGRPGTVCAITAPSPHDSHYETHNNQPSCQINYDISD